MTTGATDEQIEAAIERGCTFMSREGAEHIVELGSRCLVPPDHRIIRAKENHLTPELRVAIRRVLASTLLLPSDTPAPLEDIRVIEAALAEAER